MDKNKGIVAVIVSVFMIVNIWITLSMKEQIKYLQNEISRMHSEFNNEVRDTSQDINNLRRDLLSKIEKGNSLLSSFETETEYKNRQIVHAIKVVPKEKRVNEKVFLSLGSEKKEAIYTNGLGYTATFVPTMPQKIIPIVSLESPEGVRQEVLPETYLDELLSLGYESGWNSQSSSAGKHEDIFMMTVYARDEKSHSLLSGTPDAAIVIKDVSTGTEIVRKGMQSVKGSTAINKELGAVSFSADLSEYSKKEGSYSVWIEMKTESGIFYREQIASFSNNYEGNKGPTTGGNTGGTGVLYPVW